MAKRLLRVECPKCSKELTVMYDDGAPTFVQAAREAMEGAVERHRRGDGETPACDGEVFWTDTSAPTPLVDAARGR